ncbi:L-threonylcarbamoyladenylate synthase, partial [bacterium]|nr:L-threonylcarbamoyladenylate synthase [bacterium]
MKRGITLINIQLPLIDYFDKSCVMLNVPKKVTNSQKYVNYLALNGKMGTIIRLNLKGEKSQVIAKIAARLRADGIVCLPSDTCYGLSCLATSNEATEKLRRIKKRDASRPFILIVKDTETAIGYTKNWSAQTRLITDFFWPGPISIVVPFQQSRSCPIAHTGKTIAVRVPASDILREIMAKVNRPLWSTSANEPKSASLATLKCIPSCILDSID